jgi:hypothetical protein
VILDQTPKSLNRLENLLAMYWSKLTEDGLLLNDEQTVELVRELTAYIGELLIRNIKGEWVNLGTLWNTEIVIEGPFKIKKEGKSR